MPKISPDWEKKFISVIMVCFMCFAIYMRIPLDQMFYTILFFLLGIHMGGNNNSAAAAQLTEQVKHQQDTIAQLSTLAMKQGQPVILPKTT